MKWISAIGFGLGILSGMCCYVATGNSLDLFTGTLVFGVLLTPFLSAIVAHLPGSGVGTLGISLGIAAIWWVPVYHGMITIGQWVSCVAVLVSLLATVSMLQVFLMTLGITPTVSCALNVTLWMLWLTWQIWAATSLAGSQLHYSVLFHPLFAINHAVINLGIWTEQPVAYNLTNFGQDVQYQMPFSTVPIVVGQSLASLVLGLAASHIDSRWSVKKEM